MLRRNRNPVTRDRARELRHQSNIPEQLLWDELRGSRFHGFKFRRQHPIGRCFADFYCAAAMLIVELDGETHREKAEYDARRQAFLERKGLFVLRCPNEELYDNLEGLLERIWQLCTERVKPQPPLTPDPSPRMGEGNQNET